MAHPALKVFKVPTEYKLIFDGEDLLKAKKIEHLAHNTYSILAENITGRERLFKIKYYDLLRIYNQTPPDAQKKFNEAVKKEQIRQKKRKEKLEKKEQIKEQKRQKKLKEKTEKEEKKNKKKN